MTTPDEPQRLKIPMDPIAALFKTRWEQECQNSTLLADQVRVMRIQLNEMQWRLEALQNKAAAEQETSVQEAPAQEEQS